MTVRDTRETRGNLAEQTDFGEAVTGSLQEQHRHLHLAQMPRPFGAGLGNSYALFRAPTGSRSCACSKGGTVQILASLFLDFLSAESFNADIAVQRPWQHDALARVGLPTVQQVFG